jgi:protein-tyrosine phosphatase
VWCPSAGSLSKALRIFATSEVNRTVDGRYVRWGMVYRSNDLFNLTAKDYKYLDGLGIRLVCDVRSAGERMRSPTHWVGQSPEFFNTPVGQDRDGSVTAEEDLKRRLLSLAESKHAVGGYNRYALEYAPQYGRILRRIAAGDVPMV